MALQTLDLWTLVQERPQIDPNDLAAAVVSQISDEPLDYRTRMLIRDSVDALHLYWGRTRLEQWLARCAERDRILEIRNKDYNKIGFPSLKKRLKDKTNPDKIIQFLAFLGQKLHQTTRIEIAGSVALILKEYLTCNTEDVNIVGEIPEEIRLNCGLMNSLESSFGLRLSQVQSYYFPRHWRDRVLSLNSFDRLKVFLVDVYDVAWSKLFSPRIKDFEDLRVLQCQIEKSVLSSKLASNANDFLVFPNLRKIATANWKILYGEPLPQ